MPDRELLRATEELAEDVQRLSRRYRRGRKWLLFSALAFVLGVVLALTIAYQLIEANNRKFCDVVGITAANDPPPTTPRGIEQVKRFEQLGRDLNCPIGR